MYIMLMNYDNGLDYEESCTCTGEIVTEGDKIITFETAERAKAYAFAKYEEDNRDNDFTLLINFNNTLAYQSDRGESFLYNWVNLNDPKKVERR